MYKCIIHSSSVNLLGLNMNYEMSSSANIIVAKINPLIAPPPTDKNNWKHKITLTEIKEEEAPPPPPSPLPVDDDGDV